MKTLLIGLFIAVISFKLGYNYNLPQECQECQVCDNRVEIIEQVPTLVVEAKKIEEQGVEEGIEEQEVEVSEDELSDEEESVEEQEDVFQSSSYIGKDPDQFKLNTCYRAYSAKYGETDLARVTGGLWFDTGLSKEELRNKLDIIDDSPEFVEIECYEELLPSSEE
jgi:hypothetical protein